MATREELLAKWTQKIEEVYRSRTPKSRNVVQSFATKYVPDGDYREAVWLEPYPTVMSRGDGCYLYDIDDHQYLDYSNCWTAMVWGNNHPKIVAAVSEQIKKGFAMAAPTESAYEWARMICERMPSVERIRFATSGSEAVMFGIRAARAFSGKDKILKMEGNYHGTYDPMEPTVGWRRLMGGLPKSVEKDVAVTRFNDKAAATKAIEENKNELAAVIVEGIMGAGGLIPPEDGFLNHLREVTARNNILMILDEVITFRLATGGAQQIYGVKPDITIFGKTIGGGFPVGAFGGRADVMGVFSPKAKRPVHHSGTMVATPVCTAAGMAGLKEMTREALDRINALGDQLAAGLRQALKDAGLKCQITGYGSLHQLHFTAEPVTHAVVSLINQDRDLLRLFHLSMMNKDIFIPRRGMYNVSMAMTEKEIKKVVAASAESLAELKPLIKEIAPQLIA